MKQSQQAFLPHVNEVQVTTELRPIGLGVVLDPRANKAITDMPHDVREVTIVVGPEGGLTNAELNALQQHGFETFRLGQSVLRTSTAGPAALASILTTLRSW
jgi:16S rRNA (uracil1498-N3)-methyltransferase